MLFLEDAGETAYRLDRMLTQWRSAGVLRGVAGVLIGSFDAASGSLVAKPGQSGYLVAGPYVRVPVGRYRVTFMLETDAAAGTASPGAVDVNAYSEANSSKVIATKPIESKSGPNVVELEFEAGDAGAAYFPSRL